MFNRTTLFGVLVLGLLTPLPSPAESGSAYPFRDARTTHGCFHQRSTTCVAGAKAARDGSFAVDMRVEAPLRGRSPVDARAASGARFDLEQYVAPRAEPVTYRLTLSLGRAEAERTRPRPHLGRTAAFIDPDHDSETAALSQVQMTVRDTFCGCTAGAHATLIDTEQGRWTVDDIVVIDVTLDGAKRNADVGGWVFIDVSVGGWAALGSEGPIQGDGGSIGQRLEGTVSVERTA